MHQQISKSSFKAQALEIMRGVEETGEDVLITAHGKKSLILTRYKDKLVCPLEKLKNTVVSFKDPLSPIADEKILAYQHVKTIF